MRLTVSCLALAVALSMAACADLPTGQVPGTMSVPGATTTSPTIAGAPLTGTVTAPAGIQAEGAATIFQVAEVGEKPLANAEVFLADAGGNAIPGIASVKTDASGKFNFPDVPKDFTFVVAAKAKTKEGKPALLQSLAKPGALGASVEVSAASTLVTAGVVDGNDLGEFNPATFKTATESTRKQLTEADLPDLSDRAACVKRIGELANKVQELGAAISQIKKDMKDLRKDLEELKKQLANRQQGQPPQGDRPPVNVAGQPPQDCATVFKRFDLDGDGVITTEEYGKTHPNLTEDDRRAFREKDRNGDGRIAFDEACGNQPPVVKPSDFPTAPPTFRPSTAPATCEQAFKDRDANHDGAVTLEEFLAFKSPSGEVPNADAFKRADANADGKVTLDELCRPAPIQTTPPPSPKPLETPRPTPTPTPTTTASVQPRTCGDYFKLRDLNADGAVTLEEWLAFKSPSGEVPNADAFKRIDLNADGKITVEEFCAPRPTPTPTPHL
jgi:Ca2+-binding EF-hand superfamily protein